jgi:coniferyl-aldehyde dehydrogenase
MIKPSELVPNFSALLCDMVAAYFAPDEIAVVTGDATTAKSFVALPFDHLFFTGSTSVGRQVAVAAAQNLTPVTLELGGKSPAIVDADSDIADVASKLVVGKMLNAGQTCIAPDYVLIAPDSVDALVAAMRTAVASLYPTLANNPDYTSILSDRHRAHLNHLLDDARSKGAQVIEINPGNEQFASTERKMPLNLVLDAHDDMAVMQDEIFGPILPFVLAADTPAAISYVNCHPRPLALYWFGRNKTRRDQVLEQTIAGGVTVNDTVWHIGQEHLPFGGVGASGIGAYHGEAGFLAFSKEKPVLYQSKFSGIRLLRPPYGVTFRRILDALKRLA